MLVERTIKVNVEHFELGDIIKFKLKDGEQVEAMAVSETSNGMLFMFIDCLSTEYQMFENLKNADVVDYKHSDLRKKLNGEILESFPEEIRERMVSVNSEGDLLRIPTECEILLGNFYGKKEHKSVKRFYGMEGKRNRMAWKGSKTGIFEWYWLMNRHKNYDDSFICIDEVGYAKYANSKIHCGVRPVFMLNGTKGERK